jgi:DNA-binding NarL/FixJ family response regulator
MRTILVAIGDDDPAFREAVRDALTADPRFTVVAAVGSGDELRQAAVDTRPDVALVDIRMPGGGPDLVRALVADDLAAADDAGRAALVVVAVSAQTGVDTVRAMVRAGATGYLAKGQLGGSLPDLVHRCASGQVVLAVPSGARALRQLAGLTA